MYITPGLSDGGGLWPIQAMAQVMALASMHIGSGPGVCGLSGMQVKPLVPLRSVVMVPSALARAIVAWAATLTGAALIALRMGSIFTGPLRAPAAGLAARAMANGSKASAGVFTASSCCRRR